MDVDWTYEEYSDEPDIHKFENDEQKIKWYTEQGCVCKDNVVYGPNSYLIKDQELAYYLVVDSYGAFSTINIVNEIDGFPVTSIFSGFENCSSLETLIIGKNVEGIECEALLGCSSLSNIIINEENNFLVFKDGLLYTVEKSWGSFIFCSPDVEGKVIIPDNTMYISTSSFSVADKVTELVIGKELIQLVDYGYLPNLFEITISEENETLFSWEGVVYSKDEKTISYICPNRYEYFEIPESVERLECTFNNCSKLKTIVINKKLAVETRYSIKEPHIDSSALHSPFLEEILVKPDNPYLTSYKGCLYSKDIKKLYLVPDQIKDIVINEDTELIQQCSFSNVKADLLVIPDKVTFISFSAFDNCSIDNLVLGSGILEIHDNAFAFCSTQVKELYYHGNYEQLAKVEIHQHNKYLALAERYYYSEEKPNNNGRYWHYVNSMIAKW